MSYTVKQLAKLSRVSVRTLHYYDEIGLLKPAYYGDNQYRYYEEEQLLLLQQILFYRELGFQLNDIQKIIYSDSFDKIGALETHKNLLKGDLDRINKLIKTIEKTVAHLRGEKMVKLEEIFDGFTDEKQQLYMDFLVNSGVSQNEIDKCESKVKSWSKDRWLRHKHECDKVFFDLADAIEKNLLPSSPEVQAIIKRHYELTKLFWTPTKETFIGLADMYRSHEDFVKFYHNIHPKLLDFLTEAMTFFSKKNLS